MSFNIIIALAANASDFSFYFFAFFFFVCVQMQELKAELRRLLGNNPGIKIEEKQAKLYITGHHVFKIKRWLRMLGF
jgi:hypothetical protein